MALKRVGSDTFEASNGESMNAIGNMARTGHLRRGSASSLVEVVADSGLKHWVIEIDPRYAGHPALTRDLSESMPFLEDPGVMGVMRLSQADRTAGWFAYPTGAAVPLADLLDIAREEGGLGIRAAVELLYVLGEALIEGARKSQPYRLGAHGALDPLRVVFKPDGQALLLGYGLPSIALEVFLEHPTHLPDAGTLRYCAPETLRGERPTLSTDFYVLALLALEMAVGEPVYDGTADEIRQQVLRGEGVRRLYEWRGRLPAPVRDVLQVVFRPDRAGRFDQPYEWVQAYHALLKTPGLEGERLVDCVARLAPPEGGASLRGVGRGTSASRDTQDGVSSEGEGAGLNPVWARESAGRDEASASENHEGDKMADESARDRLKNRLKGREPAASSAKEELSARDRLKQRLKSRAPEVESASADEDDTAVVQRPDSASLGVTEEASPGGSEEVSSASPTDSESEVDHGTDEAETSAMALEPAVEVTAAEAAPNAEEAAPALQTAADLLAQLKSSLSANATPAEPSASASARLHAGSGTPSVTMTVRREGGDEGVTLREDQTVGDLLHAALGSLPGVRVNLLGQVTGWARLESAGRRLNAATSLEDLDIAQPVDLVWVTQVTHVVELEVRGATSEPVRLRAPVEGSLPAGAVLEHLCSWLSLPQGDWQLTVDGQVLASDMLLLEAGLTEGSRLVVSR